MSEQEFELYLKLLSRCLGLTSGQREQIADELRDHLEERLEELAGTGVPRDQAVLQALDEFGDAAVLAGHFTTIAHLKRRRFLMRLSLGSVVALAAALLVAFAFWPENHAVHGPQFVFAQKFRPQDPAKAKAGSMSKSDLPPAQTKQTPSAPKPPLQPAVEQHVLVPEHPLSSDIGQNRSIEEALETRTEFSIDPQPLKDAVDFIAQIDKIPILFDTKALEDASVDTSAEVRLPYSGLKLRQMLTLLLQQGSQPLAFYFDEGVLRISTVEEMRRHIYVVIYDCRDLIQLRSMYPGAAKSAQSQAVRPKSGLEEGEKFSVAPEAASVARQFGGAAGPAKANKKSQHSEKNSCAPDEIPLIRVIKYAGDPEDWAEEEGAGPKITEVGGLLVVNQNALVHHEIKRILADLRRMKKTALLPLSTTSAPPRLRRRRKRKSPDFDAEKGSRGRSGEKTPREVRSSRISRGVAFSSFFESEQRLCVLRQFEHSDRLGLRSACSLA